MQTMSMVLFLRYRMKHLALRPVLAKLYNVKRHAECLSGHGCRTIQAISVELEHLQASQRRP